MKYFYSFLLIYSFLVPTHASSEMPEGAESPAFQQAVEIWLWDDDETSLPALSRLANAGNHAAQILLGQIEQHEIKPSRFVRSLSRDERRAIFRAPVGKFGKSWLAVAAEHSSLANAFLLARNTEQMEAAIPVLHQYGERGELGAIVERISDNIDWDKLITLELKGVVPPERRYLVWHAALSTESAEADRLIQDAQSAIKNARLQGILFFAKSAGLATGPDPVMLEAAVGVARWYAYGAHYDGTVPEIAEGHGHQLLSMDETRQLAVACRALCPKQAGSCAQAAWSTLGGYTTYLDLGSPVATLIPAERYVQSRRASGELMRRLAYFFEMGPLYRTSAAASQCLADHLKNMVSK